MLINISNTIYNYMLQNAYISGEPYTPLPNTTLNEKFNIYPDYYPEPYKYPVLNLAVFGINLNIDETNNLLNFRKNIHSPIDGSPYNIIPLLIRPVDEALSAEEISLYRLKTLEVIDGTEYQCYYGIKISNIVYDSNISVIRLSDISTGKVKYDTLLDTSILNPLPNNNLTVNTLTTSAIVNSLKVEIDMSDTIVSNIDNAVKLKLGLDSYNISEIAICTGIDAEISDTYKESMWTQVNYFITTDIARDVIYDVVTDSKIYIDIGGMTPFLFNKEV